MDDRPAFSSIWAGLTLGAPDSLPFDATRRPDPIATANTALPAPSLPHTPATRPSAGDSFPGAAALPRIPLAPSSSPDVTASPDDTDLEITGLLGEGGMGRVHVARQRSLARDVAIKTVRPDVRDPAVMATLVAEALITGSLEHPCIVPVHAMGVDRSGRPLLVMKRVEGVTWADVLHDADHPAWTRLTSLPAERLVAHLEILLQVCNAIALAHDRGVVHRDIKPANVMVGWFGEVYVVDWGIAARLEDAAREKSEGITGTPAYMAPELVTREAGAADERTDVYLLGATLHEIVTGAMRHQGATLFQVLSAAYESAPFAYGPEVPAELASICNRATHADKARRFESVRAFRQAVADYLHHRGSIALSDAARARLDELPSARDPESVHRISTECRFGFMQALRAWPANDAAREGLERCVVAMIDHAIAERRPAAARALLADLAGDRPELRARIEALEAELQAERARRAELERLEHEMDLTVSSPQRVRISLALAIATSLGAVATIAVQATGGPEPRHEQIVVIEGVLVSVWIAVAVVARRALTSNAVNRRVLVGITAACVGILANRVAAIALGASIPQTCVADSVLLACLTAFSATVIFDWLWTLVPVWLVAALVSAAWPGGAMGAFSVAVALAAALMYVHSRRALRS